MIIDGVILLVDPDIRKLWFGPSYYCYANISNMISEITYFHAFYDHDYH